MDQSTDSLFPILSSAKVKRATESDRRLPSWLSHPIQFPATNLVESSIDIDLFEDYIDQDLLLHIRKNMLIERMFPVQKCLIPHLSKQFKSRFYRRPNDICVSSPTGSGKTLAFAIPIVNHLKKSLARSLRALIVLPSRDLANQVHKAFQELCKATNLRCSLADGNSDNNNLFARISKHHQRDLTENMNDNNENCKLKQYSILQNQYKEEIDEEEVEYVSNIDILVSTPGVLVDLLHTSKSTGFSLKDLEILVIDEADRLMTSYKHDWLNTIERTIFPNIPYCLCSYDMTDAPSSPTKNSTQKNNNKRQRICFSSTSGCAIKNAHLSKPLHKLLFSATLSSDPQLLMQMNLFQPRLFLATKPTITGTKIRNSLGSQNNTPIGSPTPNNPQFSSVLSSPVINPFVNTRNELLTSTAIPEQLEEKMFITETKEKLFIMWYLFHELKYKNVICFTNQLPTSFRLCKFLNEIAGIRAVEFSSNIKNEARQKYLNEFKGGRIEVIVSTDMMARGIDVDDVEYVISYDMPSSEVFYVHRIGRTARAGKKGTAITLVDTKQLVQFKKIVQLAHKMPNSMRLSDVIEEMKVPQLIKKNAEKYDLYTKTLENFEDKINKLIANRKKYMNKTAK